MLPEFDRQVDGVSLRETWDRLLSDAGPCDHIFRASSFIIKLEEFPSSHW